MKDSQSPRAARRGPRMFTVSLLIFLLLALTTAVALPQEQAAEGPYPTDAEVAATLKPVVLSESRSGDMTTLTVEIPVGADTFTTSNRPTTNWSNDPTCASDSTSLKAMERSGHFCSFRWTASPPTRP